MLVLLWRHVPFNIVLVVTETTIVINNNDISTVINSCSFQSYIYINNYYYVVVVWLGLKQRIAVAHSTGCSTLTTDNGLWYGRVTKIVYSMEVNDRR